LATLGRGRHENSDITVDALIQHIDEIIALVKTEYEEQR
jgi:hypothetical protein